MRDDLLQTIQERPHACLHLRPDELTLHCGACRKAAARRRIRRHAGNQHVEEPLQRKTRRRCPQRLLRFFLYARRVAFERQHKQLFLAAVGVIKRAPLDPGGLGQVGHGCCLPSTRPKHIQDCLQDRFFIELSDHCHVFLQHKKLQIKFDIKDNVVNNDNIDIYVNDSTVTKLSVAARLPRVRKHISSTQKLDP